MMLCLDSFDHYSINEITQKWTQQNLAGSSTDTITTIGRRSTQGWRSATGSSGQTSGWLRLTPSMPAPSGDTCIFGVAVNPNFAFAGLTLTTTPFSGNTTTIAGIYYQGTAQVWFRPELNGKISVYRGTTLLGTTSIGMTQGVFNYVEGKVKIHGSTGTVDIRIDGINVLSLTGQNTQGGSAELWDEFVAFQVAGTQNSFWYWDDFYLADGSGSDGWTDFMGDLRIDATYPNAAGNTSNGTRSTGADQSATIDEALTNGDSDYNTLAAVNDKDTLNFPNAPVAGASIAGIQIVVGIKKPDGGAAGHKAVTRIAGTDYDGTERGVPGGSYKFLRECWGRKPSDSAAWTESNYNAAEFGYKKSS